MNKQQLRPVVRPITRTVAILASGLVATVPGQVAVQAQAPDFVSELSSFAPGGPSSPFDDLGRPTPETQARVRDFALSPLVPPQLRDAILGAVDFASGTGEAGGPPLVGDGGPVFTQFAWPSISARCIGGELDSVGTGIGVSGPTEIPAPGANFGEAVFLFTALGTPPAAPEQGLMQVHWFNINNFAAGVTPLFYNGINPEGPTTLSGRALTGPGTVIAVLSGSVNTTEGNCLYAPTATIMEVR